MKIINKIKFSLFVPMLLLAMASCTHTHSEDDEHSHDNEDTHVEDDGHNHQPADEHEDDEIHLTREQIETMSITFGSFSEIKINDYIRATGTLGLPPNAYSAVSAKANGFIKDSNTFVEGNYVKKGERIAYLENPEFIQRQQQYLEVAAELSYLRLELVRQQQLADANAGVLKNVQKLQSEVQMKTATMKGIAKQLNYLGINADELTTENITDRITLTSPMSGYITTIKMHNGMYVTPELELMEIVSETHLHLELDIFENDIAHIKEEQRISYTVPALGNIVYDGDVHVIGKEFNVENKTVRIHGHLGKKRPRFVKDLFVEAKIWLNDQTVTALPEKAIIKDGASSYIFVANMMEEGDEIVFERIMVIPGTSDKGFTAVKLVNNIPEGKQIVTDGAFYVYAQSKAGELEHNH